jgi:uncharacterized protein (TIGR02300 family)
MRSTLASPELGAKQVCPACQTKFYDLGRRPAVCPKCAAAFDPEEALRSRRVRARSTPADYEADEETPEKKRPAPEAEGFEDEAEETPEIDEAAEAEPIEADDDDDTAAPGAPEGGDADLGVDFEEDVPIEEGEDEDVPFLEEEDEDFAEDGIEGLPENDREER